MKVGQTSKNDTKTKVLGKASNKHGENVMMDKGKTNKRPTCADLTKEEKRNKIHEAVFGRKLKLKPKNLSIL